MTLISVVHQWIYQNRFRWNWVRIIFSCCTRLHMIPMHNLWKNQSYWLHDRSTVDRLPNGKCKTPTQPSLHLSVSGFFLSSPNHFALCQIELSHSYHTVARFYQLSVFGNLRSNKNVLRKSFFLVVLFYALVEKKKNALTDWLTDRQTHTLTYIPL